MNHVKKDVKENPVDNQNIHCGIIMPIAEMGEYSESHWQDVKNIIAEATSQIEGFNIKTEIVSDSGGEINIIHKNIISNIYDADIVICDISGRNPNVLFELGMRLTFDKPTIIIKDDKTPFIFDTGAIETLIYPKDLRFGPIVRFKELLAKRLKLTYEKSQEDPSYSTFLGNFGEFKVPKLNQTTVTDPEKYMLSELYEIKESLNNLKKDIAIKDNVDEYDSKMRTNRNELMHSTKWASSYISDYIVITSDNRSGEEIYYSSDFKEFIMAHGGEKYMSRIPAKTAFVLIEEAQKQFGLKK